MGKSYQLTVLIVDDNRLMREVIKKMLSVYGHQILLADGHKKALEHLDNNAVDLILMDIEMPEMNGYELTETIRKKYPQWIPIIFLSSNDSESALAKGIDAGGDDYLTKPVKEVILNAKVRAMVRIALMKKELDLLNRKLAKLNTQDPLTKVLNRRALESKLKDIFVHRQRHMSQLAILMLDIDHFKNYNDNYGHPEGDLCLKKFALVLKSCVNRETDIVARYGGEEFIIILPFTDREGAELIAQNVIEALAKENIEHAYSSVGKHVTASIGISVSKEDNNDYLAMIKNADQALYTSKANGRNCYSVYESDGAC